MGAMTRMGMDGQSSLIDARFENLDRIGIWKVRVRWAELF
jgi:hypothetical protein